MPPLLHPRSTATSTLFAGTLLASFIVVAIPHVLPCPRSRRAAYQDSEVVFDSEGRPTRRVRKPARSATKEAAGEDGVSPGVPVTAERIRKQQTSRSHELDSEVELFRQMKEESELRSEAEKSRECPVPKPKTMLQKLIGNS